MTFHISTKHTDRRCRCCKHNLFIGCGFYSLGRERFVCEGCVNLIKWYLLINLMARCYNEQ